MWIYGYKLWNKHGDLYKSDDIGGKVICVYSKFKEIAEVCNDRMNADD